MPNGKEKFTREEVALLKKLAKRIKNLRVSKGYSNYEHFANESGLSRTQYGKYEVGDNLKFLTLVKVLKALDIPLSEFFSEGFND
ncbi:MAG: transcriptional regulator [Sphingobacteriales bacterium]|nr:transcriptional regulator [Sphingobacteriales bacterium]